MPWVSDSELAELATRLPSHLPASYVQFLSQYGPVLCPAIQGLCPDCGPEHPYLRQFLTPQQVLKTSRELWARQLPVDLFVFALDGMGNPFCFRQSKALQSDASVFFLSPRHEKPITMKSFDDLLRGYVAQVRQVPASPTFPSPHATPAAMAGERGTAGMTIAGDLPP